MNRTELDALPAVVDVCTAAKVMGLSRTAAYELIRLGEWPTPVFRLGKLIRIPTAPMLSLLGLDTSPPTPAVPAARPLASGQ
ncbi:DNA-binding protein [Kineosporia sp. R_H_3]|uniref:DNA-binding protein n=1 Tax=Kineosporia sp. R_H_3 TaxID=1961848 RepID=UPI000B4A5927|nr:DNA-binding protein [Kineosporia sp. R_H_3]